MCGYVYYVLRVLFEMTTYGNENFQFAMTAKLLKAAFTSNNNIALYKNPFNLTKNFHNNPEI